MKKAIITHINKHVNLSQAEEEILLSLAELKHIKKKEHLLEAGEICRHNYFIINGCFRLYIINKKGVEQVIQFGIDNWWITEYMSLKSGKPSDFYIQAVEDSDIVALSNDVQRKVFEEIPKVERYFRLVLEKAYAAQLMRINYLFNLSGEERYRHFNAAFPDFVQRVPQYLLASYLGVTPEFLSKVRAKKL